MTASNLKYAMFTRAEMERRYTKAREIMAQKGIKALFISGEENFQYFAGTSASLALHRSLTRPSIFILPMEHDPIIVSQGENNLELGCYVTDVRDYSEILSFPLLVVLLLFLFLVLVLLVVDLVFLCLHRYWLLFVVPRQI